MDIMRLVYSLSLHKMLPSTKNKNISQDRIGTVLNPNGCGLPKCHKCLEKDLGDYVMCLRHTEWVFPICFHLL
jgi:hypothetical protein